MKTKNLFLSMLATAGMLFATSCTQDELHNESSKGDFVTATFTIGTSDVMGTRAADPIIGKGVTVNYVACAVYDENGDEMDLRQYVPITNKEAKFETRLAKGQKYRVAFFAYNGEQDGSCTYYDLTDLKNIIVKSNQKSNIEARDAFTNKVDVDATATMNKIEQTVVLKRPFAQLNLGIDSNEFQAAKNAGVVVSKSYIKVSNVYTAFNAYEDMVVEGNADVPMEFTLNAIPNEDLLIDANENGTFENNEKYTYLALNYLLVGNAGTGTEKSLTDVEFVWETENGKQNASPITFINIPVQRNYRTNIYGKLLTSPADFTIKIDEKFENSPADDKDFYFEEVDGVLHATATTPTTLQDAINKAQELADENNPVTVHISYTGNGLATGRSASTTDIIISQIAGLNYIIDGCNNEFDGTFHLYGNARNEGKETLRIKNFQFKKESGSHDFITCNTTESTKRYAHNVSVENCTFVGNTTGDVVGMRYRQCYNMSVKNCTFENMHSLMWATGTNGISLDNVTIKDSKSGVSFGTSTNVSVENSNFDVKEDHGIRADGSIATNLVVKNTTINATTPIIVRTTTAAYKVALEGDVKLNATNAYHVIFTNGADNAEYVIPTGEYGITGAEGFNVYPMADNAPMSASSNTQLSNVIAAGATTINLAEGTYKIPNTANNQTLTISGTEDTKIDITSGLTYVNGADITFEGVTIQSKPNGEGYQNGFADLKDATFNNCVINGTIGLDFSCEFNKCEFNIEGNYYNVWTWGAGTATFNECTFNCDGKALLVYANVLDNGTYHQTINITDCIFNDNGDDTVTGKAAIEITNTYTPIRTYDVIIKETKVNGFAQTVPGSSDFNATFGSVENGNIGTNVWGNKCKLSSEYLNVVIDDVDVY